jgi:hypothetical protein
MQPRDLVTETTCMAYHLTGVDNPLNTVYPEVTGRSSTWKRVLSTSLDDIDIDCNHLGISRSRSMAKKSRTRTRLSIVGKKFLYLEIWISTNKCTAKATTLTADDTNRTSAETKTTLLIHQEPIHHRPSINKPSCLVTLPPCHRHHSSCGERVSCDALREQRQ